VVDLVVSTFYLAFLDSHVGNDSVCLIDEQDCSLSISTRVELSRPKRQNLIAEISLDGKVHRLSVLRSIPNQPSTPIEDQRSGGRDIRTSRCEKDIARRRIDGKRFKVENWTAISLSSHYVDLQFSGMCVVLIDRIAPHRPVSISVRVIYVRLSACEQRKKTQQQHLGRKKRKS